MSPLTRTVLILFGTRPEVIKLAPVIAALERSKDGIRTVVVTSAQHKDLLYPFIRYFQLRIDHNLEVMETNQTPTQVCARVLTAFDPILTEEQPDLVLVQGDTTTAMAGALAAFHRRIPVGHVEAGLRSGNILSPFPEEMNRSLITRLARLHFAATPHNVATLQSERVPKEHVILTGNPVVDALKSVLANPLSSAVVDKLLKATNDKKMVVLTTHRRESFGETMAGNLRALRAFVETHDDVALVFPVHPNPSVRRPTEHVLGGIPRIHVIEPLNYFDFVRLLSCAWLIVSDSGGVQEESPTLGIPLLVIRENTERPEALETGVARLVGGSPQRLSEMLEEVYSDNSWMNHVKQTENPFGDGRSSDRIAAAIQRFLRKKT